MESKYYAPSDDEFRIGFEFYSVEEIDGSINGPYTIKDCYDLEVQARNCWKNYSDILIKYLDKEDIESFGFKTDNKEDAIYGQYMDEQIYIDYNKIANKCKIHTMDSDGLIFTVKNKSELKKLLIQLEIINE